MPEESAPLYGEEGATRYDAAASPRGVRILLVLLLACGLALAFLPLTVLLRGGEEPGRIAFENGSGATLRNVRVVRLVGDQERLVGAAHELADGASTDVTFAPDGGLRLRVEFDTDDGGHHELPLILGAPVAGGPGTTVQVRPGAGLVVVHGAAPELGSGAPHQAPGPADPPARETAPPAGEHGALPPQGAPEAPAGDETAAVADRAGPFPLPAGWSEEWRPWFEHVDWVVGPEAGLAAARAAGKPALLFYTATW